jgi:hypothetical protein
MNCSERSAFAVMKVTKREGKIIENIVTDLINAQLGNGVINTF